MKTLSQTRASRTSRLVPVWYATGILASTASTYLLFLIFSLRSDPEVLGLFALWAGGIAVVIQFIDGVSAQRIAQVYPKISILNKFRPGSVNFLNRGRFAFVVAVGAAITGGLAFVDARLAVGVGIMLTGQGAYSLCVSTRVFSSSPKSLLNLQLFNCGAFTIAAIIVFLTPVEFTSDHLLMISGAASLCAAAPFLLADFLDRGRMKLKVVDELRLLYTSDSWMHLGGLTAYQAVNACGSAVDTLLTAVGGLRTAAEYQVVRRPMLALSSLNVAVGQHATSKYSRGSSSDWKASLIVMLPVLILWPLLGYIGLSFVRWITPDEYDISILGGLLLAGSFAIGAFLQVTGTVVLVRLKTRELLMGAVLRIVVLVVIAFLAVPSLGVVGLGLALLLANLSLLGIHMTVLLLSDRTPDARPSQ